VKNWTLLSIHILQVSFAKNYPSLVAYNFKTIGTLISSLKKD